ncbi:MAG: glycosyltransferase [Rikenellaceae bacterium]|jgi:glycosyltransferase involved in cell wall biosynthesis|nr:glycosyltransferase [Rikenellaceae bacterium]
MNVVIESNCRIPAFKYGGIERVIWSLGKEFFRMGHRVTFLVGQGSTCDFARVIERDPEIPIEKQIPEGTDIVHFNNNPAAGFPIPHLVTIHGNVNPPAMDFNSVFISRDHARRHGSECFVYNGLDWDEYGPVDLACRRTYFHFLGKAAWRVKNVKDAIVMTKRVPGGKLMVFGGDRFNFKMGMRFTFSPRTSFYGMVGGEEKYRLLNGSKGLVFPVKWDEPFGLAITESLYFGAPVFGTPYGSLPELITPEVGFLSDSRGELTEAMAQASGYSAAACHEYARDRFNSRVMAEVYLRLYETVLSGKTLNEKAPGCSTPGYTTYQLRP